MFGRSIINPGKNVSGKKHSITRADIWLMSGMVAAAFILLMILHMQRRAGSYAEVFCDKELLLRQPLMQQEAVYYLLIEEDVKAADEIGKEDCTAEMFIRLTAAEWEEESSRIIAEYQDVGYNILLCQDGEVRMIQSSCPDQICVRHKAVSAVGENIICLPHRIVVTITGDEEHTLDGVVY